MTDNAQLLAWPEGSSAEDESPEDASSASDSIGLLRAQLAAAQAEVARLRSRLEHIEGTPTSPAAISNAPPSEQRTALESTLPRRAVDVRRIADLVAAVRGDNGGSRGTPSR